jgi:hypothetical protein
MTRPTAEASRTAAASRRRLSSSVTWSVFPVLRCVNPIDCLERGAYAYRELYERVSALPCHACFWTLLFLCRWMVQCIHASGLFFCLAKHSQSILNKKKSTRILLRSRKDSSSPTRHRCFRQVHRFQSQTFLGHKFSKFLSLGHSWAAVGTYICVKEEESLLGGHSCFYSPVPGHCLLAQFTKWNPNCIYSLRS